MPTVTIQPTFETARVDLVPVTLGDLDAMWTLWRDPDVRRYLFDDEPVTRERAAEVLTGCGEQGPAGLGLWTIRVRPTPAVIGCIGLMPVGDAAEHEPALAGLVEPIVALAPAHWGEGYADEALVALVTYAFGALALPSLAGVTDLPNEASHRMLSRVGFAVIGECPGPRYHQRLYRLERAAFARAGAS